MVLSLEHSGRSMGFVENLNLSNKGKEKAFMEASRCIRLNGLKPKKKKKKKKKKERKRKGSFVH